MNKDKLAKLIHNYAEKYYVYNEDRDFCITDLGCFNQEKQELINVKNELEKFADIKLPDVE